MSSSWQHISVKDFFSQNNWSGKSNVSADNSLQEISWLCQRIEDFFSHSNWQGGIMEQIKSPDFSLTLNVTEFLQLFAWEIKPSIASLPELEINSESSISNDELRLDNYTNLF